MMPAGEAPRFSKRREHHGIGPGATLLVSCGSGAIAAIFVPMRTLRHRPGYPEGIKAGLLRFSAGASIEHRTQLPL
jgi:hypothetical protein